MNQKIQSRAISTAQSRAISTVRSRIIPAVLVTMLCSSLTIGITGCNSRIEPSKELKEVKVGAGQNSGGSQSAVADTGAGAGSQGMPSISFEQNMAEEQAVADGVLKAWRQAIKDKKE